MEDIQLARIIGAALIAGAVVADIIRRYKKDGSDMLKIIHVVFFGLAAFVLFGNKFSYGELSIESQAQAYNEQQNNFEQRSTRGNENEFASLIDGASGVGGKVWGQLIIYRTSLRFMLRKLSEIHAVPLERTDHSITYMLNSLSEKRAISEELKAELEKLRNATYTAQWGAGDQPSHAEVVYALENGKNILTRLHEILSIKDVLN